MAKEQITGAEALMRSLEYQGVKTLFGYPGGSIMPTFDALYHHRDTLNHILVRHEQGAAHAAQGFARVSGESVWLPAVPVPRILSPALLMP